MTKLTSNDLKSAFYMEPREIVDFFQSKGLKISYDWHEVYEEAHAKAFTVAKMTELDLLKDTQDLLTKSIKDGTAYNTFKKEAEKLFEKKGWVGTKDGVELGTPRRIKTIYTNNINSAYSVGKYKEMLEEVDVAPYWQYMTLNDGRERPEHKALHGKVFRADDPFWTIFFPPNGWGCRCVVRVLTKRMVEQLGLKVESTEGKIHWEKQNIGGIERDIPVYKFDNSGQIINFKPDTGWGTNLGVHAWGIDVQAWNKVEDLPEKVKYQFIAKMAENPHKKAVIENLIEKTLKRENFASRGIEVAINWFSPEIIKALYSEKVSLQSPIIAFEDRQVKHSLGARKVAKQKLTEEQFKNIYDYIANPDEKYIDTELHAIIYVKYLPEKEIIDDCDCIKIPVVINSTDRKRPVNYIGTTGRVKSISIKSDKRYKKIE